MEKKYVVTIARQFGSLGRSIAHSLSDILGIEYYDRDIVDAVAKNLGLPVSVVSDAEETKSRYFGMSVPLGNGAADVQKKIFEEESRIIHDLTDKESCIIVGRCADYVLGNQKNALHVYIYAPYEARYRNCLDVLQMTPDAAKKMLSKVDKARAAYHKHYAGYLPGDFNHQNLMIDSSLLGIDGTARALADVVHQKFFFDEE